VAWPRVPPSQCTCSAAIRVVAIAESPGRCRKALGIWAAAWRRNKPLRCPAGKRDQISNARQPSGRAARRSLASWGRRAIVHPVLDLGRSPRWNRGPESRERISTAASVWPARLSTPPSRAAAEDVRPDGAESWGWLRGWIATGSGCGGPNLQRDAGAEPVSGPASTRGEAVPGCCPGVAIQPNQVAAPAHRAARPSMPGRSSPGLSVAMKS